MISFMAMSNMLSDQLKHQYKSKSLCWRQEKQKLLQTFQPKEITSQSQQKSRTSERKSKIKNLMDSLYNQCTPDKNKSVYYQFQSQIAPQQQQSSQQKELTLSTIINKYQKQVDVCNHKTIQFDDPIAQQIIDSFQQLKKQSAKKQELQLIQSEQKIRENSAHKINILNRINQIRDFIDQQLNNNNIQNEQNKEFKNDSDIDISKSIENRISQNRNSISRSSIERVSEKIKKLTQIKSCNTLDVGIQVSFEQSKANLDYHQQFDRKLDNQQQTSPIKSHYYQVEQSVTSEYAIPPQQFYEELQKKQKNSVRTTRRSEFLQKEKIQQTQERFSVNIEEKNKFQEQDIFENNSSNIFSKECVLENINQNRNSIKSKERLSEKSNYENRFSLDRKSCNKENITQLNYDLEDKLTEILDKDKQQSNISNNIKIIHALNFDSVDFSKTIQEQQQIPQTSVDTNRFNQEVNQILAQQNQNSENLISQQQNINFNMIQNSIKQLDVLEEQPKLSFQDFVLNSNYQFNKECNTELQITLPISEQMQPYQITTCNQIPEENEPIQQDNITGLTNLQYSEDTQNQRLITHLSNNQDDNKFKPDSYATCEILFKEKEQIQNIQNTQLQTSSFEQWLSNADQNKKIFNFNCHSQYFQKDKCDHSTQMNKSDCESDEEIKYIKRKHIEKQQNQALTLILSKINSLLKINLVKSFYNLKEQGKYHSSKLSQQLSTNTFASPQQSQTTIDNNQQSKSKIQGAQEKISNLLKTIMEETGSDTLRMLQNKQSTSPSQRKINLNYRNSKKCSTISIISQIQSPVQEINERIKVNFIQDMGLESPTQKHTEHAELNDFSPIAEPMEFQDQSILKKKDISLNESKHYQVLSNHIAIQKAKIGKKFQQIHYKTGGQHQLMSKKENYQF